MNHNGNEQFKWLLCPVCGSKTRIKTRLSAIQVEQNIAL
ncbi:MAG: cysteine-rich KTR domain-containing protein [Lachnospiraceae bacterium]|nr:cysteine-rich KTR domain-containing protein [Lachnospiraceae bacterium]